MPFPHGMLISIFLMLIPPCVHSNMVFPYCNYHSNLEFIKHNNHLHKGSCYFRALLGLLPFIFKLHRFLAALPRTLRQALIAGLVRFQHLEIHALRAVGCIVHFAHPVTRQFLPPERLLHSHNEGKSSSLRLEYWYTVIFCGPTIRSALQNAYYRSYRQV
mgnify:FL=1